MGVIFEANGVAWERCDYHRRSCKLLRCKRESRDVTHLPGPEEWVHESVHAGQGKVLETLLDGIIPGRRVCPEGAVGVQGFGVRWSAKPERAVVESIAKLSGDVDAKRRLATREIGISDGPRGTRST